MNLIERIRHEMDSDEANNEEQSQYLISRYEEEDATGRAAMDYALLAICGWQLSTLIRMQQPVKVEP